jgi:hypothetical protein
MEFLLSVPEGFVAAKIKSSSLGGFFKGNTDFVSIPLLRAILKEISKPYGLTDHGNYVQKHYKIRHDYLSPYS